jgi:hypothetical protein
VAHVAKAPAAKQELNAAPAKELKVVVNTDGRVGIRLTRSCTSSFGCDRGNQSQGASFAFNRPLNAIWRRSFRELSAQ